MDYKVLDGTDLILSSMGHALGFSTGCKVSTSAETGERKTKEASSGKWKEQYVKSFSEQITADGVVLTNGSDEVPTYDQLKAAMLKGEPIDAAYNLRDGDKRTGKTAGGYSGKFIITSLELGPGRRRCQVQYHAAEQWSRDGSGQRPDGSDISRNGFLTSTHELWKRRNF